MSGDAVAPVVARLRLVLANMYEVLERLAAASPPDRRETQVRIERWALSLESIISQAAPDADASVPTTKDLLTLALSGLDVSADASACSLHDLTQLAVALGPDAKLTVLNWGHLTPIEQACITSARPGQVSFT